MPDIVDMWTDLSGYFLFVLYSDGAQEVFELETPDNTLPKRRCRFQYVLPPGYFNERT